jgi:hypothetical protein
VARAALCVGGLIAHGVVERRLDPHALRDPAEPITRSAGMLYSAAAIGRMKSRSPPEAMYVLNPCASR